MGFRCNITYSKYILIVLINLTPFLKFLRWSIKVAYLYICLENLSLYTDKFEILTGIL